MRFNKAAYRQRTVVERLINCLQQLRSVCTRYENRPVNYLAKHTIAADMLRL